MKYRHIGYFYKDEDLVALSDSSADEIISYLENGYVVFGVLNFTIENDAAELNEFDGVSVTTDGKYIVVSDLPTDLGMLGKPGVCDFFIDIYKRVE